MPVVCPHCQSKALITSANVLCETMKDLYYQCNNTQACGASFV
ncbi:ogr/Delta-like zinc finger family protein [Marinomonas sp.]